MSRDEAYATEASDEARIAGIAERLCGDDPFTDVDTLDQYVVVSVERNGDKLLVNKRKPHLKFTGIVAWVLQYENSKWRKDMIAKSRVDATYRYKECQPMDPSDFDWDQRLIVGSCPKTPEKKRPKRDRDELTPELVWKPSTASSRTKRGQEEGATVRTFFTARLEACQVKDFTCLPSHWLYNCLLGAVSSSSRDLRIAIETVLEFCAPCDIQTAFREVLSVTVRSREEMKVSKKVYLQFVLWECFQIAEEA